MGRKATEPVLERESGASRPSAKLSPGPGMAAKDVAAHQLDRIHKATVGIVAEQGYKALKVRDVVSYAEVSTRAFYEHFQSKEDCFLRTYDLISARASRRIIAAQAGEPDWRARPQLAYEEFLLGLEQRPQDARLALIEAYAAGIAALERAWRAERAFGEMLVKAFARSPSGTQVPSPIVEGIVGGVISVSKDRLLADETVRLRRESKVLINWALALIDPGAARLTHLDRQTVRHDTPTPRTRGTGDDPPTSTGDRALMLKAAAEMAAVHGYSYLTATRVRAAARVSRSKFNAHFDDIEDCYLNALEQHTAEAIAQAARAQSRANSWEGGVYRAIAALCEHVATDTFLVKVFLDNDFPPSPNGIRSREGLAAALAELLSENMPPVDPTIAEASTAALWSLFHHHIIRDWALRRELSATLSYLLLAPTVGAGAAVAAIRGEQEP